MIGTCSVFLRCLISCASSKPGHAGHADVEDEQGELLCDQREQRLIGRFRAHEPVTRIVQDGFQYRQVFRLIVYDQNIDRIVVQVNRGRAAAGSRAGCAPVLPEGGSAERADSSKQPHAHERRSWSVLTGLAM